MNAFQSSVPIGSGIQVTTPITGKTFPHDKPLAINWTGGDPNTFRVRSVARGPADREVHLSF